MGHPLFKKASLVRKLRKVERNVAPDLWND
jgi:hypothetical protein